MSRALMPRLAGGLLLVLLPATSGCIKLPDFTTSKKSIDFYTLEYAPPEPVRADPLVGVVLLRRLTSASLFGTDRMVTRGPMYSTEFSYYKRWAASPSSMMTDFLYRDLSDSGLFDALLNGPGFLRPDYEISGTVEAIQAIRRLGGWQAALTVNILFFPYSPGDKTPAADRIFQKRYEITAPCEDGNTASIVASLSTCMQTFSRELIRDMEAYLLTQSATPVLRSSHTSVP